MFLRKHLLSVLAWIFALTMMSTQCLCQNLVPNPSFEEYTECPPYFNQGEPLQCVPWVTATEGTPDFFHTCATPGPAGVPMNWQGYQWPLSGEGYVGLFTRGLPNNGDCREYVMAPLNSPLVADEAYLVSFYVSVADTKCPTIPFGALFTVDPVEFTWCSHLEYDPQVEANGGFLGNHTDWTLISRCFVADGGERYITLGNFRNLEDSPIDTTCDGPHNSTYYYLDSLSVEQMPSSFDQFVLDPAEGCGSYTIFPGQAQNFFWSDSTTNPTLTVYESGTYYVTLSNECAFSYGEIDVTIIPDAPPVALPNDTLLCSGESLEISLDPDAGTYEWNDDNTSNEYTISEEGMYIVTLTDDCDMTSDTINVTFLDPPQTFSLGEDTLICDGDAFTISLDPALGDFTWQDGSNSSSFTIEDDGTYALTISNLCGQTEDEIIVDFVQPIVVDIGPDQMTICDGEEFEIELDPNLGDFHWHDDSDGNSFTISEAGTVSVTISNACYSETDEMLVDVLYQPVFTLGPDITVCSGQFPITLDMSGIDHAQSWEWTGGSTQSIYQVTAPGTYSVTISNDCFAMSDEIEVSVGDVDPVVTLPPDQLLCPGQTFVLDAGGLMGEYLWQDVSTGSTSDADTFLVTQAGTYALSVTNICGSGADTVIINYIPELALPDLGPDFTLCPGETGVLYANVDGVSYLWSEGATGTIGTADSIVITLPGIYSVQISDACTIASDTIVITSNANPPDVDLPASLELCQGDTVIIDAGITGVNYLWQDGSVASYYVATQSGVYHLQVSNACGTDIDSVVINDAGAEPLVMLGPDISLCPGDVVEIIPAAMDVDTWLWQDSSTSSSLFASTGGVVYVTGSNQCGRASDTIIVTMLSDAPVLDLGEDIAICPDETVTLMITEVDVEIEWHDATTDSLFLVNDEGLVYATVSNACGSSSDTVMVELLPAIPDLDLGADQSLCPGETITFDPAIPDVEYLWQDGSDEAIYETSIPGAIILSISNACGSSTDTVVVIEDTNGPQVDLGEDILACEGDSVILNAGIAGVDYLWQDGTIASHFIATLSGVYHLTVSNACGSDADSIVVDIHGTIPTASLGPDTTLCDDEVLILTSDADAETDILWYASDSVVSTDVQLTIGRSGIYSLTETNHCGSASDTIVVAYQSAPVAFDLGEYVVICPGDTAILFAPITNDLVTWSVSAGGVTIDSTGAAVYAPNTITLTISNDCGIASDDVVVAFDQYVPVVELEPLLSICPDQSVTLDVTQSFEASYLWNTGSTLSAITITQPDVYVVTVSTDCYIETDDILIEADEDCGHELFIPNVFSPNGDNVNDQWEVHLTDPSITAVDCRIFDRWGNLLFTTREMPIIWDGQFGDRELNPGVYIYLVVLTKEGKSNVFSGDVTVVR